MSLDCRIQKRCYLTRRFVIETYESALTRRVDESREGTVAAEVANRGGQFDHRRGTTPDPLLSAFQRGK
jgi:hypothetical protein